MLPVAERDRAACAGNVELGQSLGVDSRLLEPEAVAQVEPALRTDGIAAAAYEPDGGLVDPGRMTLAWFAEAVALGAEPRLGAEVTDLDALDAGTVVVAAGGWTSRVLPDLPISLKRIDVARVRPLRVSAVVSDTVTNVVVRPGVGDMAWAVAYREPEGYADRDEAPDVPEDSYRTSIAQALTERYHRGAEAAWVDGWSGAYDSTPDWNPIIGFVRDGVYAIAGMSGHGLKLAPAVAECVAAELAGRTPPVDLRRSARRGSPRATCCAWPTGRARGPSRAARTPVPRHRGLRRRHTRGRHRARHEERAPPRPPRRDPDGARRERGDRGRGRRPRRSASARSSIGRRRSSRR